MSQPWEDWRAVVVNTLIAEQLNYDHNTKQAEVEQRLPCLNFEQQEAYDRITTSVENLEGRLFFLNRLGGTGKTFVYNTVCVKLQSQGKIDLCVSSSGISALLMAGTLHIPCSKFLLMT